MSSVGAARGFAEGEGEAVFSAFGAFFVDDGFGLAFGAALAALGTTDGATMGARTADAHGAAAGTVSAWAGSGGATEVDVIACDAGAVVVFLSG